MTSIIIKATGASIVAIANGNLTSGMVGVDVKIEYDESWKNLSKTAVFRAGKFERSRENVGTATTVPWEVMRHHGEQLQIGLIGRDADGNIIMPTVWTTVGTVHEGASGEIPAAPNPDSGESPSGGGAVIDDSVVSFAKTWSSEKINNEISKALIVETAKGENIAITDCADSPVQGLTVYGKTIQNGTPTPDSPVALESAGNSGSIAVSVAGKNLINPQAYFDGGVDETTLDGDVFTSNFKNGALYLNTVGNKQTHPKGTYTATFFPLTEGAGCALYVCSAATRAELTAKYIVTAGDASFTFTADEEFYLAVGGSTSAYRGEYSYKLQLEAGTGSTEYEPYKAVQTLSIPTPNGLPGIPVTSGGNYTDEKGQQWVCDEIDCTRGVYVQHLGLIESYDGQAVTTPYMSTTGALTTGASVLYGLATPIETPLADMPDISTLHTNYPNTTITADGAGVAVTYVADTKTYIDNNTGSGDSGTSITVDDALDSESTNPVQNKVVTNSFNSAINLLQTQVFPNLLPTVTEADNGKAMVVTNGAWTATAVTIPNDAHINALIDAKLGVIENGSY